MSLHILNEHLLNIDDIVSDPNHVQYYYYLTLYAMMPRYYFNSTHVHFH